MSHGVIGRKRKVPRWRDAVPFKQRGRPPAGARQEATGTVSMEPLALPRKGSGSRPAASIASRAPAPARRCPSYPSPALRACACLPLSPLRAVLSRRALRCVRLRHGGRRAVGACALLGFFARRCRQPAQPRRHAKMKRAVWPSGDPCARTHPKPRSRRACSRHPICCRSRSRCASVDLRGAFFYLWWLSSRHHTEI